MMPISPTPFPTTRYSRRCGHGRSPRTGCSSFTWVTCTIATFPSTIPTHTGRPTTTSSRLTARSARMPARAVSTGLCRSRMCGMTTTTGRTTPIAPMWAGLPRRPSTGKSSPTIRCLPGVGMRRSTSPGRSVVFFSSLATSGGRGIRTCCRTTIRPPPKRCWVSSRSAGWSAFCVTLLPRRWCGMPSQWLSDQGDVRNVGISYSGADYSSDSWWRFRRERAELVDLLGDLGWLDRMVMLQADKHALSMSSGPNNPWGGFPLFMFASLDASYSDHPEGQYDMGQSPGRGRYGTLRVVDSGHTIALHGTGYIGDTVWRSYTAYAHVEPRVL